MMKAANKSFVRSVAGKSDSSDASTESVITMSIPTILIADDSDTDRLLLEKILVQQGYQVEVASNGKEAIAQFEKCRPDIVLLDALMPVMDGFEAAMRIKAIAGEDFTPIVFLTSLDEADSLAQCLDAGGDDFLTKPYNSIILKAKLNAFMRMKDMHSTLKQQRDEIKQYNSRLITEQEVAKRIFDKVAHAGCLDAPNIKYAFSPISIFNGDVILAAMSPSGNLVVLLGDFTGHGLSAAIGAMPLAQSFYSMLEKGFGIKEILREINSKLNEILPVDVFCCALVVEFNFKDQMLHLWNGGLPDGILYRPSEGKIIKFHSTNLPLGVRSNDDFDDHLVVHDLQPDDRFIVCSDGLYEAEDEHGNMFGEERFLSVIESNQNPDHLFHEINVSINSFIGVDTLSDDISLIEIKVVNADDLQVVFPEAVSSEKLGPKDWSLYYELRRDTLKDYDPLPLMLHILMQVPFLRLSSSQIYTVIAELYSNALEHGILGLSSEQKVTPAGFAQYYLARNQKLQDLVEGKVSIALHYQGDETGGRLEVEVKDSGEGFDFEPYLKDTSSEMQKKYSGRGIYLLHSLCQSVEFFDGGSRVQAVFVWGGE